MEVNKGDKDNYTALYLATQEKHFDVVELLIREGKADINILSGLLKWSPLHQASVDGNAAIVSLLVQSGQSEVERKDKDGFSALFMAVRERHLETVKILVEEGEADVNAKNGEGNWTPLQMASFNGDGTMVEYLLRRGASAEDKDDEGWTALVHAAEEGHLHVVRLLEEEGGASLQEQGGLLALETACRKARAEVAQYLDGKLHAGEEETAAGEGGDDVCERLEAQEQLHEKEKDDDGGIEVDENNYHDAINLGGEDGGKESVEETTVEALTTGKSDK